MSEYGGLGGSWNTIPFADYKEDLFVQALNDAYGNEIRASDEFAALVWGALANVDWFCVNGDTASYSFRAAGDLIASIKGKGMYMDWYCSAPYADPSAIAEGMEKLGWTPFPPPPKDQP